MMDMRLSGDRALDRKMRKLTDKVQRRITRKAMKAGAKVIAKVAKQRTPRGPTGNLRRSMSVGKAVKIKRYPNGTLVAIIGPIWPTGAHGHWIEYGTQMRETKTGASRGKMTADPFLGPSWRLYNRMALMETAKVYKQEIERAAQSGTL